MRELVLAKDKNLCLSAFNIMLKLFLSYCINLLTQTSTRDIVLVY